MLPYITFTGFSSQTMDIEVSDFFLTMRRSVSVSVFNMSYLCAIDNLNW